MIMVGFRFWQKLFSFYLQLILASESVLIGTPYIYLFSGTITPAFSKKFDADLGPTLTELASELVQKYSQKPTRYNSFSTQLYFENQSTLRRQLFLNPFVLFLIINVGSSVTCNFATYLYSSDKWTSQSINSFSRAAKGAHVWAIASNVIKKNSGWQ